METQVQVQASWWASSIDSSRCTTMLGSGIEVKVGTISNPSGFTSPEKKVKAHEDI